MTQRPEGETSGASLANAYPAMPKGQVWKDAWVSEDGVYRWTLTRAWGASPDARGLVFVMLNPSTADSARDDPTIRACTSIARRLGFSGYTVVNLFALRSPDPWRLRKAPDPIGIEPPSGATPGEPRFNDVVILDTCRRARTVIMAWGNHGAFRQRGPFIARFLDTARIPLKCLGVTSAGEPTHPLALAMREGGTNNVRLVDFPIRGYVNVYPPGSVPA